MPPPCPGRGDEEVVEGIGDLGPPGSGALGYTGGHGKVLAVAAAVASHEGDDGVGKGDVEDGGEEERYEEALAWSQHAGVIHGIAAAVGALTLTKWVKPAMALGCGAAPAVKGSAGSEAEREV